MSIADNTAFNGFEIEFDNTEAAIPTQAQVKLVFSFLNPEKYQFQTHSLNTRYGLSPKLGSEFNGYIEYDPTNPDENNADQQVLRITPVPFGGWQEDLGFFINIWTMSGNSPEFALSCDPGGRSRRNP